MNEFEDLLNSVSQVEPGDVVTAEVLTVDATQANVAISGTGVEGVLTLRELTNDRDADINDLVKPGETLELLVLRQVVGKDTDTVTYLVSKKRLEARKAWDKLVGREEEVVTVKGTRAVKGGLSVEFEGLRGFIPASMLDTRFVRNTERFVGQEFDAKIKEFKPTDQSLKFEMMQKIAEYAANAAVSCFGIVGMAAVPMSGKGLAHLLRKESYHKGIDVRIKENRISLDFHVIVAYGVSIKAVAENLMESVEYRISQFTGMEVDRVNVYVEGVRIID